MKLNEIEAQIKAEAWHGGIRQDKAELQGNTQRYTYFFIPKDTMIDVVGNIASNLTWRIRQNVLVADEGKAGEVAYYEGIWYGPIYNAFLRYLTANVSAPRYAHRWKFLSDFKMEFVIMDVSSGMADETLHTGILQDGELVVT